MILTSERGAQEIPALEAFSPSEITAMPQAEDRIVVRLTRI